MKEEAQARTAEPVLDTTQEELANKSLTFFIEDVQYALPLTNVLEIISVQPITKVPGTPGYVKGIINLRGGIVPIVDVRLKFGQPEREYDDQTNIIITLLGEMMVGLVVDRVSNVMVLAETEISNLPEFSNVNANRYLTSISRIEGQLVMNLNCETILEDDAVLDFG